METSGSREKLNQNAVDFRMSVLLSKEDGSVTCVTKELLTKHSPLMQRAPVSRDKNPREKGTLRIQANQPIVKEPPAAALLERETVLMVNEKTQLPNVTEIDDDSEAEKLSPLLQKVDNNGTQENCDTYEKMPSILRMAQDDSENVDSRSQKSVAVLAAAEDSDYYTPEDPHTTILSPLKGEEKLDGMKKLSTPLTVLKEASQGSLPDSPISGNSHTSTRSSGDSYSSSSSTRQLLSSVTANDTPTHVTVNVDASAEGLVKHEIKIGNKAKMDCIDSDWVYFIVGKLSYNNRSKTHFFTS